MQWIASTPCISECCGMLDWNDLRLAVVLGRERTLTRTARILGISQPTASRRLAAIEEALSAKLFLRSAAGYVPTRAGETLLATGAELERSVSVLERGALDDARAKDGVVRVAVTEVTALHLLERALPTLRRREPGVVVELLGASVQVDLTAREADLAVRMVKPVGAGLVARSLGKMRYGLYASSAYLAARGKLRDGLAGHAIVQPIGVLASGPEAPWLAEHATAAEVALRTSSMQCMAVAAQKGMALAMLPAPLAHSTAGLVEISPVETPRARTVWLVLHRDARRIRRVRVVADAIAEDIAARVARR
jgi:DNA-binding transcriptional LysR family regulator